MVETDITASITANQIGQAVILVIMYVRTFKPVIIVFICNINVFDITLTDNFHYHGQSVDTGEISNAPKVRKQSYKLMDGQCLVIQF